MLRISLFTVLLATILLTSLYAYSQWQTGQEWWGYQTVGGKTNGCLCTQRLER